MVEVRIAGAANRAHATAPGIPHVAPAWRRRRNRYLPEHAREERGHRDAQLQRSALAKKMRESHRQRLVHRPATVNPSSGARMRWSSSAVRLTIDSKSSRAATRPQNRDTSRAPAALSSLSAGRAASVRHAPSVESRCDARLPRERQPVTRFGRDRGTARESAQVSARARPRAEDSQVMGRHVRSRHDNVVSNARRCVLSPMAFARATRHGARSTSIHITAPMDRLHETPSARRVGVGDAA